MSERCRHRLRYMDAKEAARRRRVAGWAPEQIAEGRFYVCSDEQIECVPHGWHVVCTVCLEVWPQ